MPEKTTAKPPGARAICMVNKVTIIAPHGRVEAIVIHQPIGPEQMRNIYALGPERIACNAILTKRWGVRALLCERDWARYYIDHPEIGLPRGFTVYI